MGGPTPPPKSFYSYKFITFMAIMNIPDDIYHGFYNKVDVKYPDMDDKSKWREARKTMVSVLEEYLK